MNYQMLAILVFFATFLIMKLTALQTSSHNKEKIGQLHFIFKTPVFAPFSLKRNLKKSAPVRNMIFRRFIALLFFFVVSLAFYHHVFFGYSLNQLQKAWLFSPFIYLFTNFVGVAAQFLMFGTNEFPVHIHNAPYKSKSLSEFWGKRWNIWVSDWLASISKNVSRKKAVRLFWAFLLSALFHEVIVALPYYFYTGKSYFGWMTLFFMIQYCATLIDQKYLINRPSKLRSFFLWLSILLPVPLFINPSVLAFFGLHH